MKSLFSILITWYELSDKPLPLWLKRKCEGDASLQDRLRIEQSLSAELRHGVEEKAREPNPFLKDRILRAVDEADRIPERNTNWVRGIIAAGCACAVAAVVWQVSISTPTEDEFDRAGGGILEIVEVAEDWQNPLDQEIDFVVSDARGALDFVASNFLPSSLLASAEAENGSGGDA